jgi:hypothetical protein
VGANDRVPEKSNCYETMKAIKLYTGLLRQWKRRRKKADDEKSHFQN